ncbi:MAG: heme exporter protein CcmB [Candidatus Zixiibacteriota bacterium]|nr:MAG: heme exporter protein CcmB [candidate division Zixibacteria bacterium]
MPSKSAGLAGRTFAVYAKDIRLELRTRYGLNAILMFGITTLAVVSFSLGQSGLSPKLLAALFWIIIFFSAMSGLAQVFIREEESGTALALRLTADPDAIYLGKLFFNLTLLSVMVVIITPLFFIFTDAPAGNVGRFVVVLVLGVLGLCGATTLVAAIIAKASVKGALFSVLSFPILVPLLITLTAATEKIFDGLTFTSVSAELQFLTAYAVVMITASVLLFKFVWQE